MFAQVVGNLLFILTVVLANAFFVAAEFAIVKLRLTQIDSMVRKGHRRATVAKHIIEHLDAYLSATQLGITFTSLGLGWLGEPLLADMIAPPLTALGIVSAQTIQGIAFVLSYGILTFLHIIIGELGPRFLALQYPEATALLISLPLQLFYRIFRPFIWLLNNSANVLLRSFGINPVQRSELVHTAEELEMMVYEGARHGVLDKTEQELISSIFEFSETTAREVMVPRTEVVAVNITTPRERLIRIVTEEGYSRLPVYRDSIDNVVGIVYTKDLISLLEHRELIVLQDIVRPPYFVPGSIRISELMRNLQQQKIHLAVVVDEFGGTLGIITMEDILEEIVGEIHDEYDEVLKDVELSADGSSLVNANMTIRRFNEKFGTEIPEDADYETLNGFLFKVTGGIPELHQVIPYASLTFTVMKKSPRRVRQLRVRKVATPPAPSTA
jgi:CBS domain containing-hemolysin-like protein